jgi:hypothetical protein
MNDRLLPLLLSSTVSELGVMPTTGAGAAKEAAGLRAAAIGSLTQNKITASGHCRSNTAILQRTGHQREGR